MIYETEEDAEAYRLNGGRLPSGQLQTPYRHVVDTNACDACGAGVGRYCRVIFSTHLSRIVHQCRKSQYVNRSGIHYKKEFNSRGPHGLSNSNQEGNRMNPKDRKIAAAAAAVEAANRRLEALMNQPDEPDYEEMNVIYFEKRFQPRGQVYIYSAVKAPDGYWYTTGPMGGNSRRTWDELVTWIGESEIWLADSFTLLGGGS